MKKILIITFLSLLILPTIVFAQGAVSQAKAKITSVMPGELVKDADANIILGNAISKGLGIIGSVALVIFIASGIIWMTSAGNEKRVKLAEQSLIWAALGLFVIFFSYIFVNNVIGKLG